MIKGKEKQSISSQLLHIKQQISDLAYNNYRIYADAGSTTEYCRKMAVILSIVFPRNIQLFILKIFITVEYSKNLAYFFIYQF